MWQRRRQRYGLDKRSGPMQLRTLRTSAEFRRVRGGGRFSTGAFLLEGKARECGADDGAPRFGFTITKKLGGAVVRNRMRRRLKAAVRALDADAPAPNHDYVIVARARAFDQPFRELAADIAEAVRKVGHGRWQSPARRKRDTPAAGDGGGRRAPPSAIRTTRSDT